MTWRTANSANFYEPIRLVGYSNGGNVAIEAINILGSEGIHVDTLVTIATPLGGHRISDDARTGGGIGQHINVSRERDLIQAIPGSSYMIEYPGATNIIMPYLPPATVIIPPNPALSPALPPINIGPIITGWESHFDMHNNIDFWREHIEPILEINTQ